MKAATLLCCLGLVLTAQAGDPLPPGWTPDLGNTTQFLDEELQDPPAQQRMNRLTGALAEISDARVAIAYLRLYSVLEGKERSALQAEQTKWLAKRKVDALAAIESKGGSLAPTEHALAYAEISKARITTLEKRFASAVKAPKTKP